MRYIDVCSGISAPTQAWKPLGWEALCFAEIEAAPRAVLAHHYPDTPLRGDFTEIEGNEYGPVDLLVGGTPCQSFSVAGLRGGLGDDRGNLALEFLKLAGRARPRWVVWENVPGVFSSLSHDAPDPCPPEIDLDASDGPADGEEVLVEDSYDAIESHALGCFLAGLQELGYGVAYRVLDAQFAGVPQRRRRIFVVGYLGDWRRAAAVLFERHSLSGHPAPRREAGERVAPCLEAGANRTGGPRPPGTTVDTAESLIASTGDVSHCLNAGGMGRQDYETETLIAHSLCGEGFDASEDGTGRGTPLVPVAFAHQQGDSHDLHFSADVGLALQKSQTQAICFDTTQVTSAANYSNPKAGDPCHPLAAHAHVPAIAFQSSQSGVREVETNATLDANNGSRRHNGVTIGSAVRRLTPRECERLQGFPDDFTLVPHRGKPMADGPRYKMLGNSMAVPVLRWIGERIAMVDALASERAAA